MKLFDKADWAAHVANDLDTNTVAGYFQGTSPWQVAVTNSHEDGGGEEGEMKNFPLFSRLVPWAQWLVEGWVIFYSVSFRPELWRGVPVIRITKRLTPVLFTQLSVPRHKQEIHTSQQPTPSWRMKKYPENYLIYVDFGFLPHNDPNGGWYI